MLKNQLNQAFNQNTGKLDLSKLRESFEKTNMSLKIYEERMRSLGPEGQQAFLQVASAITKAETPAINLGKRFDELWITMKNTMRWQLTSSALHGFIGGIQSAYGYAQDLNKSLTDIRIVSGQSVEQMSEFAQQANEAAKSLSSTTTAYTNASLIYYQQGLVGEAVTERADATIKMANVTGDTAEEVSNQLTAIWNNFYDGSKSIEYYADVITALGAATASSTSEISDGLEKFASIADAVGLSYEYATAALATVTATTRQSAETVGTAFKTLFARIQGLKLGETLEDGVDLNKYSEALNAVGISILDQKGELRDMDTLLNELGEKWDTISKAQRIALAETVAGVRQYTQLVALMDNWDYFKQNLMVAQGSEGALQEQADTYAESWEAAGKRAQAAAQGVYDSLLDDDVFIALADATTEFLSGLEQVIDTMGGLGGVAAIVANLMLKIYGDKAVNGLQSMAKNIRIITGEEEKRNTVIKKQIHSLMQQSVSEKDSSAAQVDYMKNVIKMNEELKKIKNDITQEDYEQLQAEINLYETQSKKLVEALKEKEVLEEKVKFEGNQKLLNRVTPDASKSANEEAVKLAEETLRKAIKEGQELKTQQAKINAIADKMTMRAKPDQKILDARGALLKIEKDIYEEVVKVDREYGKIEGTIESVKKAQSQWGDNISSSSNKAKLLLQTIEETMNFKTDEEKKNFLDSFTKNGIINLDKLTKKLQETKNNIDRFNVENKMLQIYGDEKDIPKSILEASKNAIALGQAEARAVAEAAGLNKEFQNISQSINNVEKKVVSFEQKLVAIGQVMSSAAMNAQMLSSLGTELANNEGSGLDKFISLFTVLSFILPSLNSDFKILTEILDIGDTKLEEFAIKTVGKAAGKFTFLGTAAKGASLGIKALGAVIGAFAGTLGTIISVGGLVIGIIGGITNFIKKQKEEELEASKRTVETQKEEIASREELINNYKEAYQVYSETGEGKQALIDATSEVTKKLGLENNKVEELTGNYEKLSKEIRKKQKEDLELKLANTKNDLENTRTELKNDKKVKYFDLNSINYESGEELRNTLEETDFYKTFTKGSGIFGTEGNQILFDFDPTNAEELVKFYDLGKQAKDAMNKSMEISGEEASQFYTELDNYLKVIAPRVEEIKMKIDEKEKVAFDIASFDTFTEQTKEELGKTTNIEAENNLLQKQAALLDRNLESQITAKNITEEQAKILKESFIRDKLLEFSDVLGQESVDKFLESLGYKTDIEKVLDEYLNDADAKITDDESLRAEWKTKMKDFYYSLSDDDKILFLQLDFDKDQTREGLLEQIRYLRTVANEELLNNAKGTLPSLISGDALSDDQISALEALEDQFQSLANVAELAGRNSTEYKAALKDVTEGIEFDSIKNAISDVDDALKEFGIDVEKVTEEDYIIDIDLNDKNFDKKLNKLIEADYSLEIKARLDIESDMANLDAGLNKIAEMSGLISDGYKVAYDDIQALVETFPDILNGYTITSDGMIQLNKETVQNSIDAAQTELDAQTQVVISKLELERDYHYAKAEALAQIGESIATAAKSEGDIDKATAEMKAGIQRGITALIGAEADYRDQIESTSAGARIDDENQVGQASKEQAFYATEAWNQAARNNVTASANAARAMIANYNKVGQSAQAAATGQISSVSPNSITQTISTNPFSSSWTESVYANTYESQGTDSGASWQDLYSKFEKEGDWESLWRAGEEALKASEIELKKVKAIDAQIASIQARKLAFNKVMDNTGKKKDGKKKDGDNKGEIKELEEVLDRYHQITREIEYQETVLDDLEKQISRTYGIKKIDLYKKKIEELGKLSELQRKKADAARAFVDFDRFEAEETYKLKLEIDPESLDITNYQDVLDQIYNEYKAVEDKYNSKANNKKAQEAMKEEMETAKKLYDDRMEMLKRYEDSVDTFREEEEKYRDSLREIEDFKLDTINAKFEIKFDVKQAKDEVRDFAREIIESFGDEITHGLDKMKNLWESAQTNMGFISEFENQQQDLINLLNTANEFTNKEAIIDSLDDLRGEIISTGEALLDWMDNLENEFPDALDDAQERFEVFTSTLEHNQSTLDTIKELMSLQNMLNETEYDFQRSFKDMQKVLEASMKASTGQAQLEKLRYDRASEELLQAEATLKLYDESDAGYDAAYKKWKALLEETQAAEAAYLESARAAMEKAREIYTAAIEKAAHDFEQILTDSQGFDLLQDKFDHYIEEEERYLDKVNELYEINKYNNKLQKDIDETTNAANKEKLMALQQEIKDRAEGNKLSQYDLDIMEAKYNMIQKQIALEEAQNNKSQVRLRRNAQGNMSYYYTADQDAIDQAEQDLADAQNEYYNIAKNQAKDVTSEIIATWQEMNDKIKEIYDDESLTVEEREARIAEIRKFYNDKLVYLEEEKNIALEDMTDAGKETIDDFKNTYLENVNDMSDKIVDFGTIFDDYINQMEDAFAEYGDTIQDIGGQTGTTYDELRNKVDETTQSTEEFTQAGLEATDYMWDSLSALQDQIDYYIQLADAVMQAVRALQMLAQQNVDVIENEANSIGAFDPNKDYMKEALLQAAQGNQQGAQQALDYRWKKQGGIDSDKADVRGDTNKVYEVLRAALGQNELTDEQNKALLDELTKKLQGQYTSGEIGDILRKFDIDTFNTGGYTGDFADSKLAFLHQKELVLNQDDTKNILSAVDGIRMVEPALFKIIEKLLDSSVSNSQNYLDKQYSGSVGFDSIERISEQYFNIQADFPNAVDKNEIQDALLGLANYATQFVHKR